MKWNDVFGHISKSIMKVTATWNGGSASGTGFVVAKYRQAGNLGFALATARHVLEAVPLYADVEWNIQSYNWNGREAGYVTFTSNIQKTGGSPARFSLAADVGLLFIPPLEFETEPVRLLDPAYGVKPSVRVGWAGFPGFVNRELGHPQLCYFEGVISSVVDRAEGDNALFYLVDGHGGQGISGGPVWYWNEDTSGYEVLGVCRRYLFPNHAGPGIVLVESINRIVQYLLTSHDLELRIAVHQDVPSRN